MHINTKKVRDYINAIIFVIAVAIIAVGFKIRPSLAIIGFILQLAVLPAIIAKFRSFFSKSAVVLSILLIGLLLDVALLYLILNAEDPDLGMSLISLMLYTWVLAPCVVATSILIDEKTKNWEIFAFYFWFLISVGLATLFLMSASHTVEAITTSVHPMPFQMLTLAVTYLELAAIPSALVLVYRRIRIFLVFIPLPILLSYAILFTGKVVRMFV